MVLLVTLTASFTLFVVLINLWKIHHLILIILSHKSKEQCLIIYQNHVLATETHQTLWLYHSWHCRWMENYNCIHTVDAFIKAHNKCLNLCSPRSFDCSGWYPSVSLEQNPKKSSLHVSNRFSCLFRHHSHGYKHWNISENILWPTLSWIFLISLSWIQLNSGNTWTWTTLSTLLFWWCSTLSK